MNISITVPFTSEAVKTVLHVTDYIYIAKGEYNWNTLTWEATATALDGYVEFIHNGTDDFCYDDLEVIGQAMSDNKQSFFFICSQYEELVQEALFQHRLEA